MTKLEWIDILKNKIKLGKVEEARKICNELEELIKEEI